MKRLALVLMVLALSACAAEPFSDGDGKRIRLAAEQLFGELERADYTTAASHWCASSGTPPTAAELRDGFAAYPRPWKTKMVSSQHTPGGTGTVNLTLTDGSGTDHPYNVDFTMAGGATQVCDVSTGTMHIDVEI
ncbi:hypothetical protein [Dactylosporangium sp. NPDC005555]|uniref:hypothetical protein n=1 Tax=Dactylosporangium sp. NPDC005555 TaxID=3154889 RepID=UPI0033ADA7FC